jgi:ATP-dependent RNA helicase RhlE
MRLCFEELRLIEPIVRAVAAKGYTIPTPIQLKAIPPALEGRDILGSAQTGSGKTGAFALPILNRLAQEHPGGPLQRRHKKRKGTHGRLPRALILAPTRELASQILESFRTYGHNLSLRHAVVYGGVSQFKQVRAIRGGIDVLVATPGRLLDLVGQGIIDLSQIEILVLDEADHMLDMGFLPDMRRIIALLPTKRQTLFFSATMPSEIRGLADAILTKPVVLEIDPVTSPIETIEHRLYHVARSNKPRLLEFMLSRGEMRRTLVFSRTKHGADKIAKRLEKVGINATAIHGNKSQNARMRALGAFKSGQLPILIATDIAARGIDVSKVTHVVNYDMPHIPETYIHRIGRTARAGASGIALSFCDETEGKNLKAIERLIETRLPVADDARELTEPSALGRAAKPAQRTSAGGGGGKRRRFRPRQGGFTGGSRKSSGRKRKPSPAG